MRRLWRGGLLVLQRPSMDCHRGINSRIKRFDNEWDDASRLTKPGDQKRYQLLCHYKSTIITDSIYFIYTERLFVASG